MSHAVWTNWEHFGLVSGSDIYANIATDADSVSTCKTADANLAASCAGDNSSLIQLSKTNHVSFLYCFMKSSFATPKSKKIVNRFTLNINEYRPNHSTKPYIPSICLSHNHTIKVAAPKNENQHPWLCWTHNAREWGRFGMGWGGDRRKHENKLCNNELRRCNTAPVFGTPTKTQQWSIHIKIQHLLLLFQFWMQQQIMHPPNGHQSKYKLVTCSIVLVFVGCMYWSSLTNHDTPFSTSG